LARADRLIQPLIDRSAAPAKIDRDYAADVAAR
jgi:hypothetical protein